ERATRALAALADRPAVLHGPVEQLMVVLGPARPMLPALVAGREKLAIHARHLVALLDQLELHVAGIGERDGQVNVIVALTFVPEAVERQFLGEVPGADAADFDPVAHRLVDVVYDKAHLPQRTK